MLRNAISKLMRAALLILSVSAMAFLFGCAAKPVIETRVVEKPVPVFCNVVLPVECKDAYAVDRVSPADAPVTINRALRQEIEERTACEVKLRAAVMGCNSVKHEDQAHP
jgi:hypothetical protein